MRRFIGCLIVSLMSCLGCPGPANYADLGAVQNHLTFHATTDFTPVERLEIKLATDDWRYSTGGVADVNVVYDYDPKEAAAKQCGDKAFGSDEVVLIREEHDAMDVRLIEMSGGCFEGGCLLGYTTRSDLLTGTGEPLVLVLVADTDNQHPDLGGLRSVAEHEIGHALGMQHVKDDYALLFPMMNEHQKGCITQPDISEFCRVNICGRAKMRPCQ